MDPVLLCTLAVLLVLALLVARVPIAFSLGLSAISGLFVFYAWPNGGAFDPSRAYRPLFSLISSQPFDFLHSYPLSMIPLFLALGHLAHQAGITTDIYHAIRVWMSKVPGGLAIASVVGCGGFSAITGSSVACASAMGKIAVPEMLRFNYAPSLATGSVAAGGTLGSLIPPSLLFVLYGIFTEQSIGKLLLAGVIPGLISLAGYLVVIVIWVMRHPESAPAPKIEVDRREKLKSLAGAWTSFVLFGIVVLGIYGGIFTPTEAAGVGAFVALAIGVASKRLKLAGIKLALTETVMQTGMIFAISIGAKMFVALVSLTGIAPKIVELTAAAGLADWQIMAVVVVVYLVLGCLLDSIGILVLTLPFVVPLIQSQGFDLIWFGVIVVKLLEVGLITPPVGLNVFVIKSVVGNQVRLETIFKGALAMICSDFFVFVLLFAFPLISLLLPNTMR
ncbi:MAG: TRAP transporter large permease [Rhodospirillales bacterium]|jgi:tripartite ATP-independent transporter DctM subunit